MGNNVTGKLLGHILLAIVRFVIGAVIGLFSFLVVAGLAVRITGDASSFDPLVAAGFAVVLGLLAVVFGNRFINSFIENFRDQ